MLPAPYGFCTCALDQRKVVCPIGVLIVSTLSPAAEVRKVPMLFLRINRRTRSFRSEAVSPTEASNCCRCNSNWPESRFNCNKSAPNTAAVRMAVMEFDFNLESA